uniref:Uncharacterized protein n=1 Tax=Arundo donax TaxID=35708 RepID=A0A0A9C7X2_ARUDO
MWKSRILNIRSFAATLEITTLTSLKYSKTK